MQKERKRAQALKANDSAPRAGVLCDRRHSQYIHMLIFHSASLIYSQAAEQHAPGPNSLDVDNYTPGNNKSTSHSATLAGDEKAKSAATSNTEKHFSFRHAKLIAHSINSPVAQRGNLLSDVLLCSSLSSSDAQLVEQNIILAILFYERCASCISAARVNGINVTSRGEQQL
jgi:hypothetical protein